MVEYTKPQTGKAYFLGVGPGETELISLKAYRLLAEADYVAAPYNAKSKGGRAYEIAAELLGAEKLKTKFIPLDIPMTRNLEILDQAYEAASHKVKTYVAQGTSVAVLCIGDPCLYGSAYEIYQRLRTAGVEGELIAGVSSITATAARAGWELASREESVKIIPGIRDREDLLRDIEDPLNSTLVIMKAAREIEFLQAYHAQAKQPLDILVTANVGFADEYVGRIEEIDAARDWPYFTTVIIKKKP